MNSKSGFQLSGTGPTLYEQVMVPLWFGRWASELLDLVCPQPSQSVLDVACGTGVTTRLAKRAIGEEGRVVGLDLNKPMLEKAQELASDLRISWIERDVADTKLESDSFDIIISQHGYHYFPDKSAALGELLRVLVPGGQLAMSVWDGHSPYTAVLCDAVDKFLSEGASRKQSSQRETADAEQLVEQLSRAGFSNVRVENQSLEIRVPSAAEFVPSHIGSMPIASLFQSMELAQQASLIEFVEHGMREYTSGNEMVYVDSVNVVYGTK